jgi:hypothetical protein
MGLSMAASFSEEGTVRVGWPVVASIGRWIGEACGTRVELDEVSVRPEVDWGGAVRARPSRRRSE